MEWINLHVSTLDSEKYLGADPKDRSTWLLLLKFCVHQENRGRVVGAKKWQGRLWRDLCRVDLKDVLRKTHLWSWDGDDLLVEFYPLAKQQEVQAKRLAGKHGGKAANSNRIARLQAQLVAQLPAKLPADLSAPLGGVVVGQPQGELLRKGREGKGRVRERNARTCAQEAPPPPDPHIPSSEEVQLWAQVSAVDPDWAQRKFVSTTETHGWVRNGKLIGWQRLWKQWFEDDRAEGKWPRNGAKIKNARALWQVEQDIDSLRELIAENPMSHPAMGQVFTPEQEADYAAQLKRRDELKAERKAVIGGAA